MKKRILAVLLCTFLVGFDQGTKALVRAKLVGHPIILIRNVLSLSYLENRGAMWGLFQGKYMLLAVCTVFVTALFVLLYLRIPVTKRFLPLRLTFLLLLGGAVGNFIDRIFLHYVTDFISFDLIDFPVFNVADIYVTVSAFLLVLLIGFIYKDDELSFLSLKRQDKGGNESEAENETE